MLNHDSTEPSSLPYLAMQLVHHHSHDKHKPNEMNKFGSLKIQKATRLGEVIKVHIGYSMVDSAHGLWVAVGLLHPLFQWHFGAMDIVNTNLLQVYLHEDDRTSHLRHTIGKLFLHTFCSCEHLLSSTSVQKSYDKCPLYRWCGYLTPGALNSRCLW